MSTRWKYQVVEVKPTLMGGFKQEQVQAELDRQGSLGWELVQIVAPAPLAPMLMVFKRPN